MQAMVPCSTTVHGMSGLWAALALRSDNGGMMVHGTVCSFTAVCLAGAVSLYKTLDAHFREHLEMGHLNVPVTYTGPCLETRVLP